MNVSDINTASRRPTPGTDVDPIFPRRWSPRSMTGATLSVSQVHTLIEAARWAPSCFNAQPWRLAWVNRESANWSAVSGTLVEANRQWADRAGALIVVSSRAAFEHNGKPNDMHAFDAGAAWMSLALQATAMGLVAHGMRGFDMAAACDALRVPTGYAVQAIIAVGVPGRIEDLPAALQEKEAPSGRKPMAEIAFENDFTGVGS